MINKNTAILLFSNTAADEVAVKTFDSSIGKKGNLRIASSLIDHSVNVAKKSKLPVFTCYSPQQSGETFGERLANATESVYEQGFDKVIIMGNDSPDITPQLLKDTRDLLHKNELILGPSLDGGVYLIGIHKSVYQRDFFENLPWQEDNLQDAWNAYSQQKELSINWLEAFQDIDDSADFKTFIRSNSNLNLKELFLSLLASFKTYLHHIEISFYRSAQIYALALLRAPPQ